ncbi:hypothetical protein [Nitrosomonas sp. Nm58]|uniref:hypothetical protein n=1 Tax=Nitrosomonas sp. Nm58 TaxID=200126 RepID=UPI00089D2245|nr:hypothetical protein [Nitrosomonas sp. Nm58]SDZ03048.1 hypothetical protein SAMN05421754_10456 [Nitrosomonas sp. Nm58]
MTLPFRILAMLVIVPATYFFTYWFSISLIPSMEPTWVLNLIASLCTGGVGLYSWKKLGSIPEGPVSSLFLGAIVLGSIGFCAGFFGPMIVTPEANQGPLLGIFITGPLGFLLGGIGGFAYWLIKKKKNEHKK